MYETLLGLICPVSSTPSQGFFLALSMKETSLDPTVLVFQSSNSAVLQEASFCYDNYRHLLMWSIANHQKSTCDIKLNWLETFNQELQESTCELDCSTRLEIFFNVCGCLGT